MNKSVLFFDSDCKVRRKARRMLSSLRIPSEIPENTDLLLKRIQTKKDPVLVLDINEHRQLVKKGVNLDSHKTILLSHEKLDITTPYLKNIKDSCNFIAKKDGSAFGNKELLITIKKIIDNDIFGPKKYMGWATASKVYHLRSSHERGDYVEMAAEYCAQMKLRSPIIDAVRTLCEEMLMNAIFDAPRDEHGKELYNHLSRREKVTLSPDHAIRFEICSDGEKLAISVTDPFGGIKKNTVLSYLNKCLANQANKLGPEVKGGAGLGLYFCYKSVNSLIINVDPGVKTEFIGILNLNDSVKELRSGNRSFHFFSQKSGKEKQKAQASSF